MRLPALLPRFRLAPPTETAQPLDDVALHPGWRRALLIALPFAALAFMFGLAFELSDRGNTFDLVAYSAGTVAVVVLEGLLYRFPHRLGTLVSTLISSMSLFFLAKLTFLLFLAPSGTDILAQMTETFFWTPVVYVLAFFIPGVRWGRFCVAIFGALTPLVSALYLLAHLGQTSAPVQGVFYALVQLNLATVVMLLLTRAFAVFQAHLRSVRSQGEVMTQLAHTDTLTGLPNRLSLETALGAALAEGRPFAVLFIDLDRFKRINDTRGHGSGDALLRRVAEHLGGFIRQGDLLARISGDEFVLLARDVENVGTAERVAQKLRGAFRAPFAVAGQPLRVTASIGFCLYPRDGHDANTLLRHADSAMYRAKAAGRDGLKQFSPDDTGTELLRTLENELEGAAERGELALVYQPLYSLGSGQLVKVEALVRWHHPLRGSVSPELFIPLAEESGQITAIGRWVLRSACQTSAAWRRAGYAPVTMAVNIAPLQFAQPDFLADVQGALVDNGLSGGDLELEITERTVLHDPDEVVRVLRQLQGQGVRIAIDDFGTGYSSLGYLKDLPLDTIKIDRSFIKDLGQPRLAPHYAFALVRAIMTIAETLDLEIVAEGVECEEVVRILRGLGCHVAQGYFFARPMPAEEVQLLLPLTHSSAGWDGRRGALTN